MFSLIEREKQERPEKAIPNEAQHEVIMRILKMPTTAYRMKQEEKELVYYFRY